MVGANCVTTTQYMKFVTREVHNQKRGSVVILRNQTKGILPNQKEKAQTSSSYGNKSGEIVKNKGKN